jgi:hypothetical protein
MARKFFVFILFLVTFFGAGIKNAGAQQKEKIFRDLNNLLINTVMDDFFPPPIASRIYVYPHVACPYPLPINQSIILLPPVFLFPT